MPKTVLIIDDDSWFLSRIRNWLGSAGHRTLVAHDGDEAVAVVEKHHREIDLIILDLALPGRNGFEILGLLRRRPSAIKILCTTGVYRDEFLYISNRMGGDAALRKPEGDEPLPPEWLGTIRQLLGDAASPGTAL